MFLMFFPSSATEKYIIKNPIVIVAATPSDIKYIFTLFIHNLQQFNKKYQQNAGPKLCIYPDIQSPTCGQNIWNTPFVKNF